MKYTNQEQLERLPGCTGGENTFPRSGLKILTEKILFPVKPQKPLANSSETHTDYYTANYLQKKEKKKKLLHKVIIKLSEYVYAEINDKWIKKMKVEFMVNC